MTDRLDDQEDGFAYIDDDIGEPWEQDGLHTFHPMDDEIELMGDEADLIEPEFMVVGSGTAFLKPDGEIEYVHDHDVDYDEGRLD